MIPLLHDFAGARVLVFGGGAVGARRSRTFAHEAEVFVISPTFADASFGTAERIRAAPTANDVGGWIDRIEPALVVATTDDEELNDAIAAAAQDRAVLVNRADRAGERDVGSVAVPAMVRADPIVVGIATGSPALSRVLRERIEQEIEGADELARITGALRATLQDSHPPEERRAAVRAVVRSERVWKALGEGSAKTDQVVREVITAELGDTE
ncbi:precorrin-2 dehydrogenase/sirohydrochlorin ferrochelatase family protein [Halocatena marina]|uniref:precorrin-2 dehydrogenase/sirohydrochlorin ferrochelatase family protein n=1 Tax=Halocatena marina TaxID=2934937 RepID=UPI002010501B|nr:NAD(P)-dependent oxidoreductase [Halocatena marina]